MLGRYVAGTFLILGVAMIMAPPSETSTEEQSLEVTRSEASPAALASAAPVALSSPAAPVAPAQTAEASNPVSNEGVEAAVLEALNLDVAEDLDRPAELDDTSEAPLTEVAMADPTATEETATDAERPEVGILAGLSDPGFLMGAVAPEPTEAAPTSKQYLFVTGNRVNVRSGPSTDYRVVGSVELGEPVELIAYGNDGWAQILMDDGQKTGFMASKFLEQNPNGG